MQIMTTKFQATIAEIKARKISLLVPDINFSTTQFQVRERKLLFPLTAINSISVLIAQQIEQIRKTGDLFFPLLILSHVQYRLSQINNY